MINLNSKDFLGYTQEHFDLAKKLLLKHKTYNAACLREMYNITGTHLRLSDCQEILRRVWYDRSK